MIRRNWKQTQSRVRKSPSFLNLPTFQALWRLYYNRCIEHIFVCTESCSLVGLHSPRTSFWSYGQLSWVKQQVCTRLRILSQRCLKVKHFVFTCKRVLTERETQRASLEKILWQFLPVEKEVWFSVLQLHIL